MYGAQGRSQLALKQYQSLERFFKSIGDLRGLAMALNARNLLLQLGEKHEALDNSIRHFP